MLPSSVLPLRNLKFVSISLPYAQFVIEVVVFFFFFFFFFFVQSVHTALQYKKVLEFPSLPIWASASELLELQKTNKHRQHDSLIFIVLTGTSDSSMASIYPAMYQLYHEGKAILKIQKFRRLVSYTGFYCFVSALSYWYTNNTTRAGTSRADQFYASYPAGTELLTDTAKLYKAALGNCFEIEEWGPIEFSIMTKHFERQGKPPYAYHSQYMAHLLSHGQLDGSG